MRYVAPLLTLLLAAGCSDESDRPIKLILPTDYVGEFTIVKDQAGTPYEKTDSHYVFVIPESGELRTPDIRPFFQWHQKRVEYADGRVLVDLERGVSELKGITCVQGNTQAGTRETGPGSSQSSGEFDGTTIFFEVKSVLGKQPPGA